MKATPLAALLLLCVVHLARPDVVRVLSTNTFNQALTSTILRWVEVRNPDKLPEHSVIGALKRNLTPEDNAVIKEQEKAVICRLRVEGIWVSGGVINNTCIASSHGQTQRNSKFEVLENQEGGARLSWVKWDKYILIPPGAVTGDDVNYIARRKAPETSTFTYYLGRLEPHGLGKLTIIQDDGTIADFEDGEILVETEPVSYEMKDINFNKWRKRLTETPMVLGTSRLVNEDGELGPNAKVEAAIPYRYNWSVSWGHGQAILTGLPIKVLFKNGTEMESFKWALDGSQEKEDIYVVESHLDPGTATNVTLHGNYTEALVPYSATLVAIFKDGERLERPLSGIRKENSMWKVTPEFSPVYFLSNGSFVPTTTTTTTTSTSTTTTTTTTGRTTSTSTTGRTTSENTSKQPPPPSPIERPAKKGDESKLENAKGENSSMQRDAAIAQASSPSTAPLTNPTLLLLLIPLSLLKRIT